ncbi:MAG: homocysteine S-methyltransferase family protein [Dermatophilaceae bacterium]
MTHTGLDLLPARSYVTDGGMETDLIFHHGVDLPEFAAFPLLDSAHGRHLLSNYYAGYRAVACAAGAGLMLESPTWRANPDWGARVGYDDTNLERVNRDAIDFLRDLARLWSVAVSTILVSGMIGPRADGYRADQRMDAQESANYHRPQIEALAGADLVTAYTLTHAGEAIGIATVAREVGVPVAISFTVETDGRLPDGSTLAAAIETVDQHCPPDWFLVNCAHPDHLAYAFATDAGSWLTRIGGVRVNASTLSHAELDEATELDDGDPVQLATATDQLRPALPNLAIVGGCCGTDARHVAAQWGVTNP